jgi:hypothetical protein
MAVFGQPDWLCFFDAPSFSGQKRKKLALFCMMLARFQRLTAPPNAEAYGPRHPGEGVAS